MAETPYAQMVGGHLVLPEEVLRQLNLIEGMKFKLLAADEGVLVLKLINDAPTEQTSVTEVDLRLQQIALAKIWDSPEEDIYDANLPTG
ncbi:hypothetical protein HYR99_29980 [Candidatus Poribacteria bacterium]|nr:hypothetical protein [Candidatus Poribacteria bacterium]